LGTRWGGRRRRAGGRGQLVLHRDPALLPLTGASRKGTTRSARILDGRAAAAAVKADLKKRVAGRAAAGRVKRPGAAAGRGGRGWGAARAAAESTTPSIGTASGWAAEISAGSWPPTPGRRRWRR